MYLTRSTISSNVSAYETDFEKSQQHCKCFDFFFPNRFFFFSDSEIQINLIVLGLQGSSSGYVSYCRILLFLLLIIIGSGITLLVMFKGDIGEVQQFLTKQFTNMMDFAQKKYKSLKSHVS